MAYTNQTTNYHLPQYVGSDKPSYLNDFNGAMNTIDGQMKTNSNGVTANASNIGTLSNLTTTDKTSLVGAVNEVNGKTGTLSNLTTTDKTNLVSAINEVKSESNVGTLSNLTTTDKSSCVGAINEVNGKVGTLSSLTTTSKTSTVSAINEVDARSKMFNLTSITNYATVGDLTAVNCTVSSVNLTLATNSDNSIFKFYGFIGFTPSNGSVSITIPTSLTGVTEEYEVNPIGWVAKDPMSNDGSYNCRITVKTNGNIVINYWAGAYRQTCAGYLIPFIIFNQNFGDYDNPPA